MAKFTMELPSDIIKDFERIDKKSQEIFGEMTKAGAEVVKKNMEAEAPSTIRNHIKTSRVYKTPSDDGINTKVYISGDLPFSNPLRKYFSRRGGNGKVYQTNEGVPAAFLAQLYEYGRSTYRFPKKPFFRKAFKGKEIADAMLKKQKELSGGLLE